MWTNFPAQSTFLPFSLLFPPYPITEHSVSLFKNPLPKKARVGCSTTTASKHLYYLEWNRSPAQVGCMRQVLRPGALGKPRGIRWRRRWEGGSGWGTHVNPWLIQVNVWQKPLQYCKVISLQLIKINGKKKYRETIIAKKKNRKKNPLPRKSERKQAKDAHVGSEFPEFCSTTTLPTGVFSWGARHQLRTHVKGRS